MTDGQSQAFKVACLRDCLLKGGEKWSCSLQHCSRRLDSKEMEGRGPVERKQGPRSLEGGLKLRPLLGQAGSVQE